MTPPAIVGIALLIGTPFFLIFGALSDWAGRRKIILAGCLIAAISYVPIYHAMKAGAGNPALLVLLVTIQMIYVTMVYGPMAAFLVEYFPARIRYTPLSVPYHLGNGWFGGLLPLIATSIVAATKNIYAGLAFPIVVALMTAVVGGLFIRETHQTRIWDEAGGEAALATGGGE